MFQQNHSKATWQGYTASMLLGTAAKYLAMLLGTAAKYLALLLGTAT